MKGVHFCVRPRFVLSLAICWWIIGWAALIFRPGPFFHKEIVFNFIIDRLFDLWMFAIAAFAGPIGVIVSSWNMQIQDQTLKVSKFFGIIRRDYSLGNIRKASLIPSNRRKLAVIEIKFDDGISIKADSWTSNFKSLWEFFGGDEKDIYPRSGHRRNS